MENQQYTRRQRNRRSDGVVAVADRNNQIGNAVMIVARGFPVLAVIVVTVVAARRGLIEVPMLTDG